MIIKRSLYLLMFLLALNTSCFTKSFTPSLVSNRLTSQNVKIVDFPVIDCTDGVDKINEIEQQVFDEVNLARKNPKLYATFLQERLPYYQGTLFRIPEQKPIRTKEGVVAVTEAIEFLKNQKSIHRLHFAPCLAKSARDHVFDTGTKGIVGHIGSDGSNYPQRINRYVSDTIAGGENISYGHKVARDIVLDLIVSDGVPHRGHRKNIFNRGYRSMGIGFGQHLIYEYVCVVNFSVDYIE